VTDAVLLASALLAGAALASPFAYIAGRRSSREELAGAVDLIEAMNAAPERDDLALPPERTGEQPKVQLYDWETEPDGDDTWQGTLGYLHSGEWAPAAPAPKQVGR
jgi:hypothetical protein